MVGLAAALGAIIVLGALVGWQRWRSGGDDAIETADAAAEQAASNNPEEADPSAGVAAGDTDSDSDSDSEPDSDPDSDSDAEPAGDAERDAEATPDDDAPDADDTTRPEPTVEPIPCPDGTDPVVCDAADFVQLARGRPFKEFPTVELLEDDEFDRALVEDFEDFVDEIEAEGRLLKALGLVEADEDYVAVYRDLLESGPVGFYDPETGRMAVRGGELNLYAQSVLVHELVHAHDDQWFDIGSDDYDSSDEEYAHAAVIEGNATRVEEQWRQALGPADAATLAREEQSALPAEDLERLLSLPRVVLELLFSPYQDGAFYVEDLARFGGEEAVDDALSEPPLSSEEILHPGSPDSALTIVDLEPPAADGAVIDEGALGELLIQLWLGRAPADGWGGDRYVTYEDGDQVCMIAAVAADTPTDLDELEDAAARWAADGDGRRVERVDGVDRATVRITGCYLEG